MGREGWRFTAKQQITDSVNGIKIIGQITRKNGVDSLPQLLNQNPFQVDHRFEGKK